MDIADQMVILRERGMTHRQIAEALGCARSTVGYYLTEGAKELTRRREKRWKARVPFSGKMSDFKRGYVGEGSNFTFRDVEEKIGPDPECYLTGRRIDLNKPETYSFDHIIPRSKGGSSSLDNMGLCVTEANMMKTDLELSDFLDLCEEILRHHGRL